MTSTVFDCFCCVASLGQAAESHESEERQLIKGSSGWHFTLHHYQFIGRAGGLLSCSWTILEMSVMFQQRPYTEPGITQTLSFSRYQEEKQSNVSHKRWIYFFQRFPYKGSFVWKSYRGDDEQGDLMSLALVCPFLQFDQLYHHVAGNRASYDSYGFIFTICLDSVPVPVHEG